MASSAIELVRQTHEDIERLTKLASNALHLGANGGTAADGKSAAGVLETISNARDGEHIARQLIDLARDRSAKLAELYVDAEGALEECARSLHAPDGLSTFYARLRDIREAHSRAAIDPTVLNRDATLAALVPPPPTFSGEESSGRYLDLHSFFERLVNLRGPNATELRYAAYVRDEITRFEPLPQKVRNSRRYLEYLKELIQYLQDFADRAYPLADVAHLIGKERERLKENQKSMLQAIQRDYGTAEKILEELGADGTKERLVAVGLKCGGRPIDRANRLLEAAKEGWTSERMSLEGLVEYLAGHLLKEERLATALNAEKKLGLTYEEIEAERAAEEAIADGLANGAAADVDKEGGEEQPLYNPKDVPLGWDGKPIPYWLYKLHGLNHEFKCEICGDATYRGPRAFERHFTSAQHVQGLRCLGISYSKEYLMITSIADATSLHEKLKKEAEGKTFDENAEAEYEDAEGNVLNQKTFNDLSRQGLL